MKEKSIFFYNSIQRAKTKNLIEIQVELIKMLKSFIEELRKLQINNYSLNKPVIRLKS